MSNDVGKEVINYTAQRVVFTSTKPFKEVLAALEEELNKDKAGMRVLQLLATATSKEEIEQQLDAMLDGKRDFLQVPPIRLMTVTMLIQSDMQIFLRRFPYQMDEHPERWQSPAR